MPTCVEFQQRIKGLGERLIELSSLHPNQMPGELFQVLHSLLDYTEIATTVNFIDGQSSCRYSASEHLTDRDRGNVVQLRGRERNGTE